jgi:hypothetical protein
MIPESLVPDLLPADLRGELCIADIGLQGDGQVLRFRMDPGRAFERRGTIGDAGGGWYFVSVADRHCPGDPPAAVTATFGMTAAEVPDELRGAAGRAWSRAAARPPWRDSLAGTAPKTLRAWQGTPVTPAMTHAAEEIARDRGITCFLRWRGTRPECVTVPPRDHAAFLSVTPEGAWSVHHGGGTYPVSGHPDPGTFAAIGPDGSVDPRRLRAVPSAPAQVRLARSDLPGTGPPTAGPQQRGPARSGGTAGRARRRRRS